MTNGLMELNNVYLGDYMKLIKSLEDESVDAIITDPPYGLTDISWDLTTPVDKMWVEFARVTKEGAPMVLFAVPPYSAHLIKSNSKMFRYSWVWVKKNAIGFLRARKAPLKRFEMVLVFSKTSPQYYPIMVKGEPYRKRNRPPMEQYHTAPLNYASNLGSRYPTDVLENMESWAPAELKWKHPTRKPIKLMEYLIKTYTKPGEMVLDPFMGSGTTAVAALNVGRDYIGFEMSEEYYEMSLERIKDRRAQTDLFSF